MTPTVQLCFIVGLTLHVLLFILNVYFEPQIRFFKVEIKTGGVGDWLNSDVDPKREQARIERLV